MGREQTKISSQYSSILLQAVVRGFCVVRKLEDKEKQNLGAAFHLLFHYTHSYRYFLVETILLTVHFSYRKIQNPKHYPPLFNLCSDFPKSWRNNRAHLHSFTYIYRDQKNSKPPAERERETSMSLLRDASVSGNRTRETPTVCRRLICLFAVNAKWRENVEMLKGVRLCCCVCSIRFSFLFFFFFVFFFRFLRGMKIHVIFRIYEKV